MYGRFTPEALEAVLAAHDEAVALDHCRLTTGHLVAGVAGMQHPAVEVLGRHGLWHHYVVRALEQEPAAPRFGDLVYGAEWRPAMTRADIAAAGQHVQVEHLLIAAIQVPGTRAAQLLERLGIEPLPLLRALRG
jgi:hypothetical protein